MCRDIIAISRLAKPIPISKCWLKFIGEFQCKGQATNVSQPSFYTWLVNPPLGWHVGKTNCDFVGITAALHAASAPPMRWHMHTFLSPCHWHFVSSIDGVTPFSAPTFSLLSWFGAAAERPAFPLHGYTCLFFFSCTCTW